MPIPSFWAVQADIHFTGRADKLVRQARSAAGAEDDPGLSKGAIHFVIPPAGMAEFDDIPASGIKLADNVIEPGLGVAIAWRQLKQKTSHPLAENIGDDPKVLHQCFRPLEFLDMSYELANLGRVHELLAPPGLNAGNCWP